MEIRAGEVRVELRKDAGNGRVNASRIYNDPVSYRLIGISTSAELEGRIYKRMIESHMKVFENQRRRYGKNNLSIPV